LGRLVFDGKRRAIAEARVESCHAVAVHVLLERAEELVIVSEH